MYLNVFVDANNKNEKAEKLSAGALRAYLILSDWEGAEGDFLTSLLPFFEPELKKQAGRYLDKVKLVTDISQAYGWNINTSVVDAFIPYFRLNGWLEPKSKKGILVTLKASNLNEQIEESEDPRVGGAIEKIHNAYKEFISDNPSLEGASVDNDFVNKLIGWLVSNCATSGSALNEATEVSEEDWVEIPPNKFFETSQNIREEDHYILARFVKYILENHGDLSEILCGLAKIGIIAEVAQEATNLSSLDQKISTTSLKVFLDTPVALMSLGASGFEEKNNIDYVINRLLAIGAKIYVFKETVEEIQSTLKIFLNTPPGRRRHPLTARALNKDQIAIDELKFYMNSTQQALAAKKIEVFSNVIRVDSHTSQITDDDYKSLYSKFSIWQNNNQAATHDATVIRNIILLRKNLYPVDVFNSKYVFLTANKRLVDDASDFCKNQLDLYDDGIIPPAILLNKFSAFLWLKTSGSGVSDNEFTQNMMLSNCARITMPNESAILGINNKIRLLADGQTAERYARAVKNDKSQQLLMDKISTGSIPDDMNKDSIPSFVDEVEKERYREFANALDKKNIYIKQVNDELERQKNQNKELNNHIFKAIDKYCDQANYFYTNLFKVIIYIILLILLILISLIYLNIIPSQVITNIIILTAAILTIPSALFGNNLLDSIAFFSNLRERTIKNKFEKVIKINGLDNYEEFVTIKFISKKLEAVPLEDRLIDTVS